MKYYESTLIWNLNMNKKPNRACSAVSKSLFMVIYGNIKKTGYRKQRHGVWGIGLLLIIIGFVSCDVVPGTEVVRVPDVEKMTTLTIATWNVQALFDGKESGMEYGEYLAAAGWSEEKYQARITALAESVVCMADKVPDVLAMQEVEHGGILKELAEGPLAKYGYQWTFFANNPEASLGLGVLSRLPFLKTKTHSVTSDGKTSPRPVMEVWLQPGNMPMALFICHWKSKLGGEDITEAVRRASARVILRRIREINAEEPDLPVIIMGDLNENYDEFYRQAGSIVCGLLPDDPKAAELSGFMPAEDLPVSNGSRETQKDFLIISRQKPPQTKYFPQEAVVLYSPWGNELEKGSYNYQDKWETIDHFLLSKGFFDEQGWDYEASEVLHKEPFINTRMVPRAYNPRIGSGLSDHLPLMLTLKRVLPF
jgi:endonuclease/exonuclease/phosphatase family metal-dependent hydrolase